MGLLIIYGAVIASVLLWIVVLIEGSKSDPEYKQGDRLAFAFLVLLFVLGMLWDLL